MTAAAITELVAGELAELLEGEPFGLSGREIARRLARRSADVYACLRADPRFECVGNGRGARWKLRERRLGSERKRFEGSDRGRARVGGPNAVSGVLELVVFGLAAPAGSKTAGATKGGRRYVRDSNPASREWKRTVAQAAGERMDRRGLLEGPLVLELVFYRPRPSAHYGKRGLRPSAPEFPTTRPDVLKLARAVEDALTGVVWRDDAAIVDERLAKRYGEPARVEVRVGRALEGEGQMGVADSAPLALAVEPSDRPASIGASRTHGVSAAAGAFPGREGETP